MGHFKQGEFDFINRTLTILKQYESINFESAKEEKYEVTLCMNCLMGLIVVPQQIWLKRIPNVELDKSWYLKKVHIDSIKSNNYRLNNIVKHLRNSVSHGNLSPISKDYGRNKKITHLKFKDYNNEGELTFEAQFPVESLKNFAVKFANEMINIMSNE